MTLVDPAETLACWQEYFFPANLVVMRHAPKHISTESTDEELSEEGCWACRKLSVTLDPFLPSIRSASAFVATSKARTKYTIKLIFGRGVQFECPPDLDFPRIGLPTKQAISRALIARGRDPTIDRQKAFFLLEEWGGDYPEEHVHRELGPRILKGYRDLAVSYVRSIYCGHSPGIEAGLVTSGQFTLDSLGGVLAPLETLFLQVGRTRIKLLARLKPVLNAVPATSLPP